MPRTIFAMGGSDPRDELINRFILDLSSKQSPSICFIGTASGDSEGYVNGFLEGFSRFDCAPQAMGLFRLPTADLRGYLLGMDIIYVGGGNTKSMLALWREWGVDAILREAWDAGIVLCGSSAGSICWFEEGTTDSIPGPLTALRCLGFLPGSNSPHYSEEPMRRPAYHGMIGAGILKAGYAADNTVGLLFQDTELTQIVASQRNACAYRVERTDSGVVETRLEPHRVLAAESGADGFVIRPFHIEDQDAVVQLWRDCSLVVPQNDPYKDIERKMKVNPELFLVGEKDKAIVATAMAGYDGHRCWVNYLAVSPALRRGGYGRRIMEAVEQRAKARGCAKINLQVRTNNLEVIEFYERIGYRKDDVVGLGKRLVKDTA